MQRKYAESADKISQAIEKNAWNGNWYQRAYFDDGKSLGSKLNDECRIDSIAQSWAVISGKGDPGREATAMESMDTLSIGKMGSSSFLHLRLTVVSWIQGISKAICQAYGKTAGNIQYTHATA